MMQGGCGCEFYDEGCFNAVAQELGNGVYQITLEQRKKRYAGPSAQESARTELHKNIADLTAGSVVEQRIPPNTRGLRVCHSAFLYLMDIPRANFSNALAAINKSNAQCARLDSI
jgi:hypothetical protein